MIEYNAERARAAVQFLVNSSYFPHHLKKLRSVVKRPRAMPFKDEAEPLNELLLIGRQSVEAMEALIQVAEFKRGGDEARKAYMREFMAAKRRRDRKVIELEEKLVGRPMGLDERNGVLLRQYQVWHKERDQLLAKLGDRVEWAEKNAAIKQFWAAKEREVEALLDEASKMEKTVQRKRVVVVEAKPAGVLGDKLKAALRERVAEKHTTGTLRIDRRR
jgi:hypothetical protein